MTPPFMPLHVAPYAKRLATAGVGTLERLLPAVRVAVDAEAARSAEGLVAS